MCLVNNIFKINYSIFLLIFVKNESANPTCWAWRKICQVKNTFKQFLFDDNGLSSSLYYSLKEGYNWISGVFEKTDWWPWMHNTWILPKHRFFIWIIAHKKLLTRARLQYLNMTTSVNCYICDDEHETVNPLFS